MAARKTTRAKKGVRKKVARVRSGRSRGGAASGRVRSVARRQPDMPASLREYSQRAGRALRRLERQLETAGRDARKRWARMLRQASHRLGRLEAQGERRWRVQSRKARHETARMLRRLENALEPSTQRRRKPATRRARGEVGGSGI